MPNTKKTAQSSKKATSQPKKTGPQVKKASSKPKKASPKPVDLTEVLTKAQQYYIQGNYEVVPPEEIAEDLELPVDTVEEYIGLIQKDNRRSRFSSLLDPEARRKGATVMTESASMVADDVRRGGAITQDMINRAAQAGDYRLAAELAEKQKTQRLDRITAERAKNSDRYHYIIPPEVKAQMDRRRV